jgi:selenocysteine lyase/cysteine desulfurase
MNNSDYAAKFALGKGVYLLNHSVGRMPKEVLHNISEGFFDAWANNDSEPWESWLNSISRFNQSLAKLFNGSADDFCPQANLTGGLVKVLSALQIDKPDATVLASENDFPSIGFALQQAEKSGLKVIWLAKDQGLTDFAVWERALLPEIDIAFISHVHYNTNARVPVAQICELASRRNIFTIVDIAQSAGIVPIDLNQWSADIVLGSCVKWLCGGPGAGFLWTGTERSRRLEPLDVGWFSHANPFEFDIKHFDYAHTASRFWGGTPSVLPYEIAANSVDLMCEIGVDTVFAHNRDLTDLMLNHLSPQEVVTPPDSEQRGGTLVLNPKDRGEIEGRLKSAGVQFDSRALGMRLSPHIYNSKEDMQLVLECFSKNS